MENRNDFSSLNQRLAEMAARLEARVRGQMRPSPEARGQGFFRATYAGLHDLFTRDVTQEGLRDLVKREAKETVRFYTRGIDFAPLKTLPWYRRFPLVSWRVFQAMAFRMSPPRRILFALAVFALVIGAVRLISFYGGANGVSFGILPAGTAWWLVATVIFALLLLMELRDKLDLKGDLEIAREIQFGLVPAHPLRRNGFMLDHAMRPANTVGGDYFDIIEIGPEQLAVVVGDVAGKGMPAALLMALLQGSLRTLISAGFHGRRLMARLNEYLCANIPTNRLVTLFYGELDTRTGELCYVNAGHNAPLLLRADGTIEHLDSTSLVLGFQQGCDFEVKTIRLEPDSRLILYTDGVIEA
ncbi:MAG: SpoIIE family protein phosphatase, partial [Acidobacteriota bacterium]